MRWLRVCFLVLMPGLLLAQNNAQNAGTSSTTSIADEVKAMREAIAQQQQQIAQQQQQMSQQQQEIDKLQKALDEKTAGTPHVEDAALHTNVAPVTATVMQDTEKPKESPLSFRIGGADFTPGGFVDFENIFRSTNTGNVTATNFGAIPYNNTVAGHLTEFRSTGQYSRFNLDIKTTFGANKVNGYIEADFNGNDAQNVFVTSNPHTNRLRLYWLDLKRGKWEFLGGQTWGLQTPNRVGVSPRPADLMVTIGEDAQTHVGLPYTRAAEFRVVWHPNENFVWAFALQNPQQYVGTGEVLFPFQFNAALGVQFDNGSTTNGVPGAPNLFPDMITKLAYDTHPTGGGKNFHVELGGLLTSAKITFLPTVANTTFEHDTKIGASGLFGMVWGLSNNFRVVANGLYGAGAGRYIIGLGPQAVVVPTNFNGATCVPGSLGNCGNAVSMVHSGTGIVGMEWLAMPKTLFGAYYGGAYFQRDFFCDVTSPSVGTCAGHPFAGFGGTNSSNAANRAIQEGTFDWTQTFWRNPQYGAVYLVTQYSYVTRAPWFVANGAPKNAHLSMAYVSLRYQLP